MNDQTTYEKLHALITVCKRTQNYKKLAHTGYFLLSNQVNEIGIRLGFRVRKTVTQSKSSKFFTNKGSYQKETIYDYLNQINNSFSTNLDIEIFNADFLKNLKKAELLYIKSSGKLRLYQIATLFELYFKLKELEVPNLRKKISSTKLHNVVPFYMYSSLLSPTNSYKNKDDNQRLGIKNLIFFELQKKENVLKAELQQDYNPKLLEDMLILKQIKKSFKKSPSDKIKIRNSLSESFSYQKSLNSLYGYFIFGLFFGFFCLGINIIGLILISPFLLGALGFFLLLILGSTILFFYIYWTNFLNKKEVMPI